MPQFPSLPDNAHLSDLFVRFPRRVQRLMAYTNTVLREEGALCISERELIAAYVSGLNGCRFCYDSHEVYARAFGVAEGVIAALLEDVETADIEPRWLPLLAYLRKLTALPSKLVPADAEAVFAAGWSEEALFDAVEICGLFNLYNRLVEGGGVTFDYAQQPKNHPASAGDRAAMANSYADFGERIAAMVKDNSP